MPSLGEAVHTLPDLKVHPTISGVCREVVLVDEFLGNVGESDADVLRTVEGVPMLNFFTSKQANLALFQERTLLTRSLKSSKEAVLVPVSPG